MKLASQIVVSILIASSVQLDDTYIPTLEPFSQDNHFEDPEWFNWGGSIIQGDENSFCLFYSRWPRKFGFLAWLTHSEIAVATSDNAFGPWTYQRTVLQGRRGDHWDAITAHNPKIKRFGDKYYLYYVSTHAELTEEELVATANAGYQHENWTTLRNNQRVGVAVADSLEGPWERADKVLLEPSGPLNTIIVNPAITQMPDGKYLLMVKGDKRPGPGSPRIQACAISDSPTGPFTVNPQPAISDYDTEDASLWYDKSRERVYAVFHAHTFFGMITSQDGEEWHKAHRVQFAPKGFESHDGTVFQAERMERPSVFTNENGVPEVFISSYRKGNTTGIFTIPMATAERAKLPLRSIDSEQDEIGSVPRIK